jgi:hypothetical protein
VVVEEPSRACPRWHLLLCSGLLACCVVLCSAMQCSALPPVFCRAFPSCMCCVKLLMHPALLLKVCRGMRSTVKAALAPRHAITRWTWLCVALCVLVCTGCIDAPHPAAEFGASGAAGLCNNCISDCKGPAAAGAVQGETLAGYHVASMSSTQVYSTTGMGTALLHAAAACAFMCNEKCLIQ